jgi:hypothetical protein
LSLSLPLPPSPLSSPGSLGTRPSSSDEDAGGGEERCLTVSFEDRTSRSVSPSSEPDDDEGIVRDKGASFPRVVHVRIHFHPLFSLLFLSSLLSFSLSSPLVCSTP